MTLKILRTIAIPASLALHAVSLHAQPASPAPGTPPAAETAAVHAVRVQCLMAGASGTRLYGGPKDAAREESVGLFFNCLDKQMPAAWPGRTSARSNAAKHFAAAHALDAALPASTPLASTPIPK